jgi:hypothetical protein
MRSLILLTPMAFALAPTVRAKLSDATRPVTVGMRVGVTPVGTAQGLMASATAERQLGPNSQLALELGWVEVERDFANFPVNAPSGTATRVRTSGIVAMVSGGPRLPLTGDEPLFLFPMLGVGVTQLRSAPVDTTFDQPPGQIAASLTLAVLAGERWSIDYGWYLFGGTDRFDVRPTVLRLGFCW